MWSKNEWKQLVEQRVLACLTLDFLNQRTPKTEIENCGTIKNRNMVSSSIILGYPAETTCWHGVPHMHITGMAREWTLDTPEIGLGWRYSCYFFCYGVSGFMYFGWTSNEPFVCRFLHIKPKARTDFTTRDGQESTMVSISMGGIYQHLSNKGVYSFFLQRAYRQLAQLIVWPKGLWTSKRRQLAVGKSISQNYTYHGPSVSCQSLGQIPQKTASWEIM